MPEKLCSWFIDSILKGIFFIIIIFSETILRFNYYLFQLFVNRRKLEFINVAFCSFNCYNTRCTRCDCSYGCKDVSLIFMSRLASDTDNL